MKVFFRLVSFARPYRRFIPFYMFFAVLTTIFSLANFTFLIPLMNVLFNSIPSDIPLAAPEFELSVSFFKQSFQFYFYKSIESGGKIEALKLICIILFISVLLANLFRYLSQRVLANMRTHLLFNLRDEIYRKLISMDMSFFHSKRKGDIISVVSNDLNEVENSVVNALIVVAREPFTIVGFFVLLFSISVKLTLFSILVLPLSFLLIAEVIKRLKKSAREGQQILGNLTSVIDETLSGVKVIQAFVSEKFMFSRFTTENKSLKATTRKVFYKRELASPLSEFLGVSVITVLLFYGGSIVLSGSGELSGSEFIAYLVLYSQILSPAKNISNTFTQIQKGIVSGERIFSILDQPVGIKNKENPIQVQNLNTSVTLKNVGFAYNPEQDRWALRNIDLIINKGKTVALVGQSGSGKSTLAELLLRFYDPVEGTIEIDGLNYKDVSKESLRSLTGMVTQEPFLFNDTIFNNIAFGWPNATEEKVIEASKIANAHEFIVQTESGYNTIIGDRGVKLSGGQRQRLSIARAVLRNPELLILDEATSALDSESERLVQDAINKIMKNRTAVVIAHRLSTIKNADLIVVLKDGLVIETGTHAQLIEQNGYYQKLINLQSFN